MTYKYTTFFRWISILSDFAFLNLALFVSFLMESTWGFWEAEAEHYRLHFLGINLFWYFCSRRVKLYDDILNRDAGPTAMALIISLLMFLAGILICSLAFPRFSLTIGFVVRVSVILSASLLLLKFLFLYLRRSQRRFWLDVEKVAIVGAGPAGMELYRYLKANPQLGYSVEGIFDDTTPPAPGALQLLGRVEDCFSYALSNGISKVFCALPGHEVEKAKMLMEEADRHMLRLRLVPDVPAFAGTSIETELFGQMPVLSPRIEPLENKANELVKRAFDVFFSLLVIVFVMSWLVPLIALLIKLDSPGPVFFRQQRSGKGNKPFYCIKFRSMQVNREADRLQASKEDPRITRVGAFLRKSSLDELPQFINVLMGDMSVVGPRPHMLRHTQDYSLQINNFMVRHFLTPGITGWAQVNGYRGETKEAGAMNRRVEADLWYLENWSFLLDVKIIFRTVWQVLRGNENVF
ncbi:undecaprenyl-phosphate glucose phosphotransferase [Nafulsella turpanensis]|uniref:undecaprenyl-phosphate glucose phosphotransferase n=1 Tax=Nafulsella turpanensis TaxID=1265690 RepID=UPI00034BF6DD|nr:undecaprenyl-phosphate glucose phosphotransferase [Nafulsella turpanensis]